MNPRRPWLRLFFAWSLAAAFGGPVVGAESTPTPAAIDPKLDAQQRADIAMLLARGRAHQNRDRGKSEAEKSFEAPAEMVPQFHGTKEMRDTLIGAAMRPPPAVK
jgi:hypothetical protein